MIDHVGIHENFKTGLWPECMSTATKIENMMVNPHKENARSRSSMENYRLQKTLKDFSINGSCTRYHQRKIQARKLRNDLGYAKNILVIHTLC